MAFCNHSGAFACCRSNTFFLASSLTGSFAALIGPDWTLLIVAADVLTGETLCAVAIADAVGFVPGGSIVFAAAPVGTGLSLPATLTKPAPLELGLLGAVARDFNGAPGTVPKPPPPFPGEALINSAALAGLDLAPFKSLWIPAGSACHGSPPIGLVNPYLRRIPIFSISFNVAGSASNAKPNSCGELPGLAALDGSLAYSSACFCVLRIPPVIVTFLPVALLYSSIAPNVNFKYSGFTPFNFSAPAAMPFHPALPGNRSPAAADANGGV